MPIYEPSGPAREYAQLALNYYKGCGHGCKYCYVPGFLGMISGKKVDLSQLGVVGKTKASTKERIETFLRRLRRSAAEYSGRPERVLLSFTSDPYQPFEKELRLTKNVLEILGENKVLATILTKNPKLALELDFDLIKKYNTEVASTIVWASDESRKSWEPDSCSIQERVAALEECKKAGLKTWVSIEPIIDQSQVIPVIEMLAGKVDLLKIGVIDPRWNPTEHKAVDWLGLLNTSLEKLVSLKQSYYIKNGLWKYADESIQTKYEKEKKW